MKDSQMTQTLQQDSDRSGKIVVLNKDLFFGVKIGNTLRSIGYTVEFAMKSDEFVRLMSSDTDKVVLGIVDINAGVDWDVISAMTGADRPVAPVLAFGSHLDVSGLRAAKNAGARRVVSNGEFHREMVKLVQRYATSLEHSPEGEEIPSEVDILFAG